MPAPNPIQALLSERRIVVCCGAGGVGKTTLSAALGLAGARLGRRTLILTIDPARRLAEAMGLPDQPRAPVEVPLERLDSGPGTVHAWTLLPEVVFEQMVGELSQTEAQARRIRDNRLYRHISHMAAGMQEYTAAEAVHRFATSGAFDLVVLDTPPSRNALDFLEAPGRVSGFLDERVISLFTASRRRTAIARRARALIDAASSRIFGAAFHAELFDFMDAFSGMFASMRAHAAEVRSLLGSPAAAFLVVTSPREAALAEARFLRERIAQLAFPFSGFILNRSFADGVARRDPAALTVPPGVERPEFDRCLAALEALAATEKRRARGDHRVLAALVEEAPDGAFAVGAPWLSRELDELAALDGLALGLLDLHGDSGTARPAERPQADPTP